MRNLWASFDFLVHFLIIFFIVQSFKNEILSKILDIQKYNIVRHWFSSKNWIFAIFFKKVSFDGFTHFSSRIHPKFSKIDFSIYPNILYIYDQNFMLVPTIKLLEFSDKNWETYESLLIFGPFFDYFFYCLKFQKWNFIENPWYSKIQHCTTLIFLEKWVFSIFFKKVSFDGFTNFSSRIHPKFSKIDFSIYPKYIIYLWSEFYARSDNQTIRIFG